jgi:hypothetical protein
VSQRLQLPRRLSTAIWVFALVFPFLAISGQSFWIDEAVTGNAAVQPTLRLWWQTLASVNGSDVQMPLYMLYTWGWEKPFGGSEISLRLANYPWFLAGQVAGAFIWADRRKGLLFMAVAACSSFIWFYLNEARPYVMQFGAACIVAYFLCALARSDSVPTWKYWLLSFALIALAGASMLGALWVGTAGLVGYFLLARKRLRPAVLPIAFCAAVLVALGALDYWTLRSGARPTRAHGSISNGFYVLYELCGFTGLGPSRLDIREHGLASVRAYLLPIGLFTAALVVLLWRCLRVSVRGEHRAPVLAIATFALSPVFFLLIAGPFVRFNVLGRHAMPAAPFVFMLLTLGIYACLRDQTRFGRGLVVSFFFLSLVSSFGVRFFPWHMKDDYRGAARAVSAMLADHHVAWWCASKEGGEYYHLPLDGGPDRYGRRFVYVRNPNAQELRKLPSPAVVALSKKDLYDENGTIAAMVSEEHFIRRQTLPAFSIWERPR